MKPYPYAYASRNFHGSLSKVAGTSSIRRAAGRLSPGSRNGLACTANVWTTKLIPPR